MQHFLPPPQALFRLLLCSSSEICHLQAGDNRGAASQAAGKGKGGGRKGARRKGGARKEPVQVLCLCRNRCFFAQCLIAVLPLRLL